MTDFDQAIEEMLDFSADLGREKVNAEVSLGRVLAEPVKAILELPPFAKSAMDGYAITAGDTSSEFTVIETIEAGKVPTKRLKKAQCSKIMTGAMIPGGAGAVVRVEYTKESRGRMRVVEEETGTNVIAKGENVRQGEIVLTPRIIRPQDIGVLSEQGIQEVNVSVKPVIGVLTTGSELMNPGEALLPGRIFNSNGFQLCGQIAAMECEVKYFGIVKDTRDALETAISDAVDQCDILILTGGVSMGDLDYVPSVLEACGARIHFHKLAVKPGKPTLFASISDKFVFGLPGNPVSTFVIFEMLVKPFVYRLMGIHYQHLVVSGKLIENLTRRSSDRLEFLPVRYSSQGVSRVSYHGSSHLHALASSDGFIRIERGTSEISKGSEVNVIVI